LPVVLTQDEVLRLLKAESNLKMRTAGFRKMLARTSTPHARGIQKPIADFEKQDVIDNFTGFLSK
jgi:hypothetical protein